MSQHGPEIKRAEIAEKVVSTATISGTVLYGRAQVTDYLKKTWLPNMAISATNMAVGKAMELYNKPVVNETLGLDPKAKPTGLGLIWDSALKFEFREMTRGAGQVGVNFLAGQFLNIVGSQVVIPIVATTANTALKHLIPEEYHQLASALVAISATGAYFTASEMVKPSIKEKAYPIVDKIVGKKESKPKRRKSKKKAQLSLLQTSIEQLNALNKEKKRMIKNGYTLEQGQELNKEARGILKTIRGLVEELSKGQVSMPTIPKWQGLPVKSKRKAITTSLESNRKKIKNRAMLTPPRTTQPTVRSSIKRRNDKS